MPGRSRRTRPPATRCRWLLPEAGPRPAAIGGREGWWRPAPGHDNALWAQVPESRSGRMDTDSALVSGGGRTCLLMVGRVGGTFHLGSGYLGSGHVIIEFKLRQIIFSVENTTEQYQDCTFKEQQLNINWALVTHPSPPPPPPGDPQQARIIRTDRVTVMMTVGIRVAPRAGAAWRKHQPGPP